MTPETFQKAQQLAVEIDTLTEAHNKIKDRFRQNGTFNLHQSYFDADFVANINCQIDDYIDRKKAKLKREFELL